MMITPGQCYDLFYTEYYKIATRMSNTKRSTHPPRVLFLGMQGNFSQPPLRALLEAGIEVCAVVMPAVQSPMQLGPAPMRLRERLLSSRSGLPVLHTTLHTALLQVA